jgi:hypothetical protein
MIAEDAEAPPCPRRRHRCSAGAPHPTVQRRLCAPDSHATIYEGTRRTLLAAGNRAQPYHSISTDAQERIRYLAG